MLGTPESERLMVTALNLLHLTASPAFPKRRFLDIAAELPWGEEAFLRVSDR
jgi:hypothetical protein